MAASILQRCQFPLQTFSKCVNYRLMVRRCLLSSAYTDTALWEQRQKDPQDLGQLASVMNRTYERKFPVSSLVIGRFIDTLSSREEVDKAEYYLYKFRHSPNCWYLRDWSVHSWFRQCLKHGARDKALYTLKNKVQFGMFPDDFTFNLLIDSFIKDSDFKGACSVVEEVMLQEAFERTSTQMLSLYALSKYLATKPELSWQEERIMGASLMLVGLKQENSVGFSARILGLALIGKVELSRGIHAVFHQMPLMWTPGYLGRALAVMDTVCRHFTHVRLSEEVLECVEKILQDPDGQISADDSDEEQALERLRLPEYSERFKELRGRLQAQDQTDPRSLDSLVSDLTRDTLGHCEEADLAQYRQTLQHWEAERHQLIQRERETKEKNQKERLNKQRLGAAQ
ncbi:28S ribosomal protein S27, mitochondrial [Pimephales promelas]|uniref:28S ribosomal protein S27, mitochondrial n=1 Tax=Pimephales promelas TaxID=90988 RepID=UPI00195589C3|nr:28S ribosomal protein S27, mitochondrial [Pimephales promelas]KAG1930277.1 28S ribosomal protein S27, mitochondrial [Pimephales promelas]